MRYLTSIVFFLILSYTFAQVRTIRGEVLNTEGEVIPYANIIARDTLTGGQIIAFTTSDENGSFFFPLRADIHRISISITALGYTETVEQIPIKRDQKLLSFTLARSTIRLEEVVVKARAYSDTLSLNTDEMNLSNRSTLRDILNKTDGMVVNEDGGITFQGKPMNKILINKKEVFINQNKVALDNLNYEIMKEVQVINNYKDKFVLDFNNIRDPVININTKPEFKGILKGDIAGGYGIRDNYMMEAKGFFFSDRYNAFATTNTNNIGKKDLSQRDVLGTTFDNASTTLRQTLSPFFMEDNRARRNIVSNNSLTLRREAEHSKTGLILYHGLINTERQIGQLTFIADTLIRNNLQTASSVGNFVSGTLEHNQLLPSRSVIKNLLSTSVVYQNRFDEAIDTILTPSVQSFQENLRDRPRAFTFGDRLHYTKLFGQRTALDLVGDYYYERNTQNLQTTLLNITVGDLLQEGLYTKQNLSGMANLNIRAGRQSLNAALVLRQNNEEGDLQIILGASESFRRFRNIFSAEMPMRINGSHGAWEYNAVLTPLYLSKKKSDQSFLLKTSQTYTYHFSQQQNIMLQVKRDFDFYNLNNLYDTIMRSFNQKVVTNLENIHQLSQRDLVSVRWEKRGGNKGLNHTFSYIFSRDHNFLQTVFDSISNNRFYFSNRVFDRRNTHNFDANTTKHLYIGSAYHRISIYGDVNYRSSSYPTILGREIAAAEESAWRPKFKVGFFPRNFFIRELDYQIDLDHFVFRINQEQVMQQTVFSNRFMLRGQGRKTEWRVNFENHSYWLERERFNVPDCSLLFIYEVSDHLSFSLVSRALLTLFSLNNFQFVQTRSDGNILTQTNTDNNLGYLLLRTAYKF